ncbi:high-potential iron-sulfur protein [Halomonas piscis]|uniref:High-potential iron-sulfur protein n=1 Tax=Halomonas piscis TaxID=3031727 RepID=A0ABY9Z1S5_9GAMM|nr:high-potential iron-sulfur protein [Halomonas piscis]WNK21089.1 high-potential iron-sulfur protein [Halomonas piscis]
MADQNRRRFMRQGALGLAALPLGAGVLPRTALAQSLPRLDPSSSNARALNYVEKASDASDHPAYEPGQTCANCMFYTADTQGCQLFPQHSVASGGWCQSWTEAG